MPSLRYHLLVVADEPSIRDLFQTLLSMEGNEGYGVLVAKDGFEALAQMALKKAS